MSSDLYWTGPKALKVELTLDLLWNPLSQSLSKSPGIPTLTWTMMWGIVSEKKLEVVQYQGLFTTTPTSGAHWAAESCWEPGSSNSAKVSTI